MWAVSSPGAYSRMSSGLTPDSSVDEFSTPPMSIQDMTDSSRFGTFGKKEGKKALEVSIGFHSFHSRQDQSGIFREKMLTFL